MKSITTLYIQPETEGMEHTQSDPEHGQRYIEKRHSLEYSKFRYQDHP